MTISWKSVTLPVVQKKWTIHYDSFATAFATVEFILGENGMSDRWTITIDGETHGMTGRDTIDAYLSGFVNGYNAAMRKNGW